MKVVASAFLFLSLVAVFARAADPLPFWNDTAPKQAIIAVVEKVTKQGTPEFVPAPERIAVFDNDGTMPLSWSTPEKPGASPSPRRR